MLPSGLSLHINSIEYISTSAGSSSSILSRFPSKFSLYFTNDSSSLSFLSIWTQDILLVVAVSLFLIESGISSFLRSFTYQLICLFLKSLEAPPVRSSPISVYALNSSMILCFTNIVKYLFDLMQMGFWGFGVLGFWA